MEFYILLQPNGKHWLQIRRDMSHYNLTEEDIRRFLTKLEILYTTLGKDDYVLTVDEKKEIETEVDKNINELLKEESKESIEEKWKNEIEGIYYHYSPTSESGRKKISDFFDIIEKCGGKRPFTMEVSNILQWSCGGYRPEFFAEVEEKYKTQKVTPGEWDEFMVSEYNKLRDNGIIDAQGKVSDVKELINSSLAERLARVLVNYPPYTVTDLKLGELKYEVSRVMAKECTKNSDNSDSVIQYFKKMEGAEGAPFCKIYRELEEEGIINSSGDILLYERLMCHTKMKIMVKKFTPPSKNTIGIDLQQSITKEMYESKPLPPLKMEISQTLAKAMTELYDTEGWRNCHKKIYEYFAEVEDVFKEGKISLRDWKSYAFEEYKKLQESGIIDENGKILNKTKLINSELIQNTPDTFRPAFLSPVLLHKAPSLSKPTATLYFKNGNSR